MPTDGPAAPGLPRRRARASETFVALALALVLFVVFVTSPTGQLSDPRYSILTSEAILEGKGFDLSTFLRGKRFAQESPGLPAPALSWHLERKNGRLLYLFPPGTPLLSLPLVVALRAGGMSTLDDAGAYDWRREVHTQHVAASLLAALTALLVLRLARHEVALLPASMIALLFALGSSLWTIAARELWSHTGSALLLGAAWLELLRWEEGRPRRPLLLGAIASAAFWVRPSNAWIALALTAFVFVRHRSHALRLVGVGALGLTAYCVWSLHYYGALFSSYVTMSRPWIASSVPPALWEMLFSTRHGLLVYSPILLVVAYLLLRYGVPAERKPLARLGFVLVAGHLVLHAAAGAVLGPDGPRLPHDIVPLLAWFAAVATRRQQELRSKLAAALRLSRPVMAFVLLVLAAASILASIGCVYVGQRNWGNYRSRLEASYGPWDARRLPQYHGLRALAGALEPERKKKQREPSRPGHRVAP